MFLRKTNNIRNEISLDEPLNVDWDGNELLLSDILGSEPDTVNRGIEAEDEKVCSCAPLMLLLTATSL